MDAVVIFFAGSNWVKRTAFLSRLLMFVRVSAALVVVALSICQPVADFLLMILRPLYPLARWTKTRVSLSH